ncbi:unnamed protein product [Leuciscus chuanchicus]
MCSVDEVFVFADYSVQSFHGSGREKLLGDCVIICVPFLEEARQESQGKTEPATAHVANVRLYNNPAVTPGWPLRWLLRKEQIAEHDMSLLRPRAESRGWMNKVVPANSIIRPTKLLLDQPLTPLLDDYDGGDSPIFMNAPQFQFPHSPLILRWNLSSGSCLDPNEPSLLFVREVDKVQEYFNVLTKVLTETKLKADSAQLLEKSQEVHEILSRPTASTPKTKVSSVTAETSSVLWTVYELTPKAQAMYHPQKNEADVESTKVRGPSRFFLYGLAVLKDCQTILRVAKLEVKRMAWMAPRSPRTIQSKVLILASL